MTTHRQPVCCGTHAFGPVRVEWRCNQSPPACEVRMWAFDSLFLVCTLDSSLTEVPFSLDVEGQDAKRIISGVLRLKIISHRAHELMLDMKYPGGEITDYRLWPVGPPPVPPVPPPSPDPEPETNVIVESRGDHDLFPYIYMRPWPAISDVDLRNRFVSYDAVDCSQIQPPSLYCKLVELSKSGDRLAMENEAVSFIEGKPPYEGGYLGNGDHLQGPIRIFGAFDARIRTQPEIGLPQFQRELERALHMPWSDIRAYIVDDPSFKLELDRCWQNLFALVIVLGYNRGLLDDLIRTVVMSRLLQRMVLLGPAEEESLPLQEESSNAASVELPEDPGPTVWQPRKIREGVWATVILPSPIFPLPKAKPIPPEMVLASGDLRRLLPPPSRIVPYAIGDLELVRQKLVRYELGEVSRIENVMKGECLETTRRSLSRMEDAAVQQNLEAAENSVSLQGTQCDLLEETNKTLKEQFKIDYQTTYGPPQEAKATGFIQVGANPDGSPQLSNMDSAAQLARTITSRTANRVAREVSQMRSSSSLRESEEKVVNRFDGTNNSQNVRGIYRWVNQIYKSYVVNYGHRLVLEFFVKDPARRYIAGEQSLQGLNLMEPVSPDDLGVGNYTQISIDEKSPQYYAALAARYGAENISPAPPERRTVSATFQSGTDVRTQTIPMPEGYRAVVAHVTVSPEPAAGVEIFGVVGKQAFTFPNVSETAKLAETPNTTKTQSLPMNLEDTAIPAAITFPESPFPPPAEVAYVAAIEVESALGRERFQEWQLQTYEAITAAYHRQKAAYYATAGTRATAVATRNPLASREAVRQSLQQDVIRQLLKQSSELTGEDIELLVDEPRYLQFFQQALEWNEMAYSFTVRTEALQDSRIKNQYWGEDTLFTAFLQAGCARVLLPVGPEYSFIIPYFLAAGMIWSGPNDLTPANRESVDLINELKSSSRPMREERECKPHSKPWEIRVPTSMVILQEGPELPRFE